MRVISKLHTKIYLRSLHFLIFYCSATEIISFCNFIRFIRSSKWYLHKSIRCIVSGFRNTCFKFKAYRPGTSNLRPKIRTGFLYVGCFYYSENLNWAACYPVEGFVRPSLGFRSCKSRSSPLRCGAQCKTWRGTPLNCGVVPLSCSVNRGMTSLRNIFEQNNYTNIKKTANCCSRSVSRLHDNTKL